MDKKQSDLFLRVIKTLHEHGALKEMVLIGSWCQLFYRDMFPQGGYIPAIRTKDMDLLVLRPRNVKKEVDVTQLLNDLGFETQMSWTSGYMKYVHEDFTVEFLMPLRGSGEVDVEQVKSLSIVVQGLRYLDFPREELMTAEYEGCKITLPRPEAFVLLKLMIHEERKNPEKAEKDLNSAKDLGTMLVGDEQYRENLKKAFLRRPKKHQKRILHTTEEKAVDIYEVLSS